MIKNFIVGLVKALLALALLFWLYQKGVLDFKILSKLFNPILISAALLNLIISFYFASWRWQILLAVQKIRLTRWECYKLNLIGLFFNYVMPGGVGGDVVKAFYIVKDHPRNRMGAGMSVLLDRVMGLYAMLLLAIVSLFFHYAEVVANSQLKMIFQSLVVLFVGFNFGLGLALSDRFRQAGWMRYIENSNVGQKLISAYEAIHSYSKNQKILVRSVVLSLITQIFTILLMAWLGFQLGFTETSLGMYFSVVPLGFMVTAIPISPAGVGVGQMAFFFLFNLFMGHESQVGPTVITAFQVLNFILGLLGIWFFIQRKSSLKEVEVHLGS
jgi:uncharacterized protein (TIRG00374 family)